MLFKIERSKSIYESNPGLRLIQEFSVLEEVSDKRMRFVILVADYKSPLRQHPEKKRRELAALEAGWTVQDNASKTIDYRGKIVVDGKDERVELAIKKYRQIQRNEDRDNLAIIDSQIENIRDVLSNKTDDVKELKERNNLLQSLPDLVESKNRLAKLSDFAEEIYIQEENSVSDKPLSLVDRIAQEERKK